MCQLVNTKKSSDPPLSYAFFFPDPPPPPPKPSLAVPMSKTGDHNLSPLAKHMRKPNALVSGTILMRGRGVIRRRHILAKLRLGLFFTRYEK